LPAPPPLPPAHRGNIPVLCFSSSSPAPRAFRRRPSPVGALLALPSILMVAGSVCCRNLSRSIVLPGSSRPNL
jgi:hypothetical protein